MCEAVCDGVRDRVEGQMGTRQSEYDLCTHTQCVCVEGGHSYSLSIMHAIFMRDRTNPKSPS